MSRKRTRPRLVKWLLVIVAFCTFSGSTYEPVEAQPSSTWTRCGGPLGGLGYDVRMHPVNPDTMFVTDSYAGVFRSFDGGQNWQPVNNGIDIYGGESGDAIKVFCLTIDPVNPSTIWLGLQNYGGIYKSTNLGENWTLKVNGIGELDGISFRGFTIDPIHPDTVYAAGEIASNRWNGEVLIGYQYDKTMGVVYKTVDGGDNWTEIWLGDNLARYVWINPRDTQILYVSTGIFDREAADADTTTNDPGGVGILKSYDGGQSWETRNEGLTDLYIGTLFMHPENPDTLLAGSDNVYHPDSSGVFLTTDGAATWTKVLGEGVQSVEFAVSNPQIAYAGNSVSVFRSDDGGVNWAPVTPGISAWGTPGIETGFPIDFQVDPNDASRIFTNNYGGGNFVSADSGHTWTVASKGYTGALVRDLAVAGDDPARVYAAVRSGIFASYNLGDDWHGRGFDPATGLEWNAVAINPLNSFHLLAANHWNVTMFETHDGAETWRDVDEPLPEGYVWRCFAFAPSDTQTVYAGTGAGNVYIPGVGIYKSTTGGLSWNPTNDATSGSANVAELAVQADNPFVVYAACSNQGVLKTIDGGVTWSALNVGLPLNPRALSIAIDPADSNHVLVGMDDAGLYESSNGGATWSSVPVGLPAEADVADIVYSPTNDSLIYIADRRSGVYRSSDGGSTWITVNDGLRTKAVNALAISGGGQVLYAGTEGEGVFRLDGADLVSVDDTAPRDPAIGLRQSYPNPSGPSITIDFTLRASAHTLVRIFDTRGRLVRVLLDESRDGGSHRLVWDGRDDEGRSMASGVYIYRLQAGNLDQSRQMVLVR